MKEKKYDEFVRILVELHKNGTNFFEPWKFYSFCYILEILRCFYRYLSTKFLAIKVLQNSDEIKHFTTNFDYVKRLLRNSVLSTNAPYYKL